MRLRLAHLLLLVSLAPAAALFECGETGSGPVARTVAGRGLDFRSATNASFADFGLPMQLAFCPWYSGAGGGGGSLLVVDAAAALVRRVNLAAAPLAEPGLGSLARPGTVDLYMGSPNIRAPSTSFADYFPYTSVFLAFVNVSGVACDPFSDAVYVADAGLGSLAQPGEVHALQGSQSALLPPNMINIFNALPQVDVEPACEASVDGRYYTAPAYQGLAVYSATTIDGNGSVTSAINYVAMADFACEQVTVRDMLVGTVQVSQPNFAKAPVVYSQLRGGVTFFVRGTPGNYTDVQVAVADAGSNQIKAFGVGATVNANTVRVLAGSGTACNKYGSAAYFWASAAAKGCGDGGPPGSAATALLAQPQGVIWNGVPLCVGTRAVCGPPPTDPWQRALLFIADTAGHAIRVLNLANNSLTLLAGMPAAAPYVGYNGDGPLPATSLLLAYPTGITYDAAEPALYLSDTNNFLIRKISGLVGAAAQPVMVTLAGRPLDGGQASESQGFARGMSSQVRLGAPSDTLISEADGTLYISDVVMDVVYAMPLEPLDGLQPLRLAVGSAPLPNSWPLPPAGYGITDFNPPSHEPPAPSAALLNRPTTLAQSTVPGYTDGLLIADMGNSQNNHVLRGYSSATGGLLADFIPAPASGWTCGCALCGCSIYPWAKISFADLGTAAAPLGLPQQWVLIADQQRCMVWAVDATAANLGAGSPSPAAGGATTTADQLQVLSGLNCNGYSPPGGHGNRTCLSQPHAAVWDSITGQFIIADTNNNVLRGQPLPTNPGDTLGSAVLTNYFGSHTEFCAPNTQLLCRPTFVERDNSPAPDGNNTFIINSVSSPEGYHFVEVAWLDAWSVLNHGIGTYAPALANAYVTAARQGFIPVGDELARDIVLNSANAARFRRAPDGDGAKHILFIADTGSGVVRAVHCPAVFPSPTGTASASFTGSFSSTATPRASPLPSLVAFNQASQAVAVEVKLSGASYAALAAAPVQLLRPFLLAVRVQLNNSLYARAPIPNLLPLRYVAGLTVVLTSIVDEGNPDDDRNYPRTTFSAQDPLNDLSTALIPASAQTPSLSATQTPAPPARPSAANASSGARMLLAAPPSPAGTNTQTASHSPTRGSPPPPSTSATPSGWLLGASVDLLFTVTVASGGSEPTDGSYGQAVTESVKVGMASGLMYAALTAAAAALPGGNVRVLGGLFSPLPAPLPIPLAAWKIFLIALGSLCAVTLCVGGAWLSCRRAAALFHLAGKGGGRRGGGMAGWNLSGGDAGSWRASSAARPQLVKRPSALRGDTTFNPVSAVLSAIGGGGGGGGGGGSGRGNAALSGSGRASASQPAGSKISGARRPSARAMLSANGASAPAAAQQEGVFEIERDGFAPVAVER